MKILFFISLFVFLVLSSNSNFAKEENEIKFTILYDNYSHQNDCKTDWGFSCLIEGTEKKILFDTGTNPDILIENIKKIKVNVDDVDLVVISHNHGDHSGGLQRFLEKNKDVKVYLPYSTTEKEVKKVEQNDVEVINSKEKIEICKDVYLTGELGVFPKEQSLVINTLNGLIVLTGCAHPGILEIIKQAKVIINKPVHLVFGGFHLGSYKSIQIEKIIAGFDILGVEKVGATHCTGDLAIKMFKENYGTNYLSMGVGKSFTVAK